ncbi:hypothetical protein M569_04359 [Genlisea aurea]|uniref:GIR1-like zinc ribbon domain-containing protein n=1 Tax=Genlisea aurea TaxID=192259 RepID=S8CUE2_9LAMI|nr:hypothetical protein M569_04359 [Genlisea aurea]
MSGTKPELELKLKLSPPRAATESPTRSVTSSSAWSSCLSSEDSTETTSSVMLVGCPRCFIYVMLLEEYPRCPICKSSVLLDVVNGTAAGGGRRSDKGTIS